MGNELILYSHDAMIRGRFKRLNGFIDICSRRNEIEKEANMLAKPYGLKAEMLPIPTTGVKGDNPDYGCMIELIGEYPGDGPLIELSKTITNNIEYITRVVYRI